MWKFRFLKIALTPAIQILCVASTQNDRYKEITICLNMPKFNLYEPHFDIRLDTS